MTGKRLLFQIEMDLKFICDHAGNFRPGAQTVPETTDKNFCETMFFFSATQHSCPIGNLK